MHYVPEEIQEIDKKHGDDAIPDPATKIWDSLRGNPGSHTEDQIVDLFILATERKNRTQKLEETVKKTINDLSKAGCLYEFSGQYYLVLNKV